jgi:hypothetical protein
MPALRVPSGGLRKVNETHLITSRVNMARAAHPDCPSSTATKIDRGTLYEWTAIIDAHDHRAAITSVSNSNLRSEAERPVRRGHGARIEPLSRSRSVSGELLTIIVGNFCLSGAL